MDRREYLKSVIGGSIATLSGGISPSQTRLAYLLSQFDQTINMSGDLGCDPTGQQPCDREFIEAAADDTLLVFPSGTYRFEGVGGLSGLSNFGIYGDGDVTFTAPPNVNGDWFVVDRCHGLLFENINVDVSATNAAPTLKFGVTSKLEIRDVEVFGRGMRNGSKVRGESGNVPVGNALLPIVRSPDGWGVVENFAAKQGGRIGTYNKGNGRVGIYIGRSHQGTIRLLNCHLKEFPNNGIYASRTHGVVQVEGGLFRNNDISQVRLGSNDSHLRNGTVEIDIDEVAHPNMPGDFLRPRGIRIESGGVDTAGVRIRDVDIEHRSSTAPGVVIGKAGGRFELSNLRIRSDVDEMPAIAAKPPTGGVHPAPPEPHSGVIEGVRITGQASSGSAIWIHQRPGCQINETTIDQPRGSRDGIRLLKSPHCEIIGGSISAGRYPLLVSLPRSSNSFDCLVKIGDVNPIRSSSISEPAQPIETANIAGLGLSWPGPTCITPNEHDTESHPGQLLAITSHRDGAYFGRYVAGRVL